MACFSPRDQQNPCFYWAFCTIPSKSGGIFVIASERAFQPLFMGLRAIWGHCTPSLLSIYSQIKRPMWIASMKLYSSGDDLSTGRYYVSKPDRSVNYIGFYNLSTLAKIAAEDNC